MRIFWRYFLACLVRLTLWKHRPQVILITGNGPNALVRELLFTAINLQFPARRTIESPDAEFSLPLTIIGAEFYPRSAASWLWVVLAWLKQFVGNRSYHHYLVLELTNVTPQIARFWHRWLGAQVLVFTSPAARLSATRVYGADLAAASEVVVQAKQLCGTIITDLDLDPDLAAAIWDTTRLPEPRLRYLSGKHGCTVVDASYIFYPIPLTSVLELIESGSRRVVFSSDVWDLRALDQLPDVLVNPKVYQPVSSDTVVLRGNKQAVQAKYNWLLA